MRYLNILLLAAALVSVQGCAGLSSKTDLRSAGTQVEDDTIEKKSMEQIKAKYKDSAHVAVTSFNRSVLITGETLGEESKTDVERIIRGIPNVKKTTNEITVGALSTSGMRRTDSNITSEIKSHINKSKAIKVTVRVVTDRGVVYLLGLLPHAEANAAAEIASTAANVKKVVRGFEYID